jgi:hypothetical protein
VTGNLDAHDDPWRKLATIRAQVALVERTAAELEQLGLTLSGRDLSAVDHADLVSYVVWISQFAGQTASVLATWGLGLIRYLEDNLLAAGMTPPVTSPPDSEPAESVRVQPRRWRRRS